MNRIWSRVGKLFGSVLVVSGGTIAAGISTSMAIGHASGWVFTVFSTVLVLLGLAPAALGTWMLHTSLKAERQAIREKFFQLLHAQQGRLSLVDFAIATRLEPAEARRHLDAWAKEFSANFEVSDAGDIYYRFATELLPLPTPSGLHAIGDSVQRILQSV